MPLLPPDVRAAHPVGQRRVVRALLACASLLLLFVVQGCSGEPPLPDDVAEGDSLPPGADGKADGYTVPSSLGLDKRGIIYLTFDDGPSPNLTPRILDVLAEHGVKATFFITGVNIAGNEAIIRRAYDEGHTLANHQWRHVDANQEQFRSYVVQVRDALHEVVGEEIPLYFRFPYGASRPWKEEILREEGYLHGGIGWDIDSLDWDFGPDEVASRPEVPSAFKNDFLGWILRQVDAKRGGVLLLHDVQSITARHLDRLITELKARGMQFGQLPRALDDFQVQPPVSQGAFIGDPCGSDADCAFPEGFCLTDGFETGYCTRTCTATCPDRAGRPLSRCIQVEDGGATPNLCLIECGSDGACREGSECRSLASPSGIPRNVCWK